MYIFISFFLFLTLPQFPFRILSLNKNKRELHAEQTAAVLRVQSESKVSCKPVTVFAGVTLLPSSSSDCWVSALKQKVNSRSIHGKSVGGKISSWFAL